MTRPATDTATVKQTAAQLDEQVRAMVRWHFSPETGTPFWIDWAAQAGIDPVEQPQEVLRLTRRRRAPEEVDEIVRDVAHALIPIRRVAHDVVG